MSRTEDSNRADLIRAVKDTLRKPKDATTQKALDNTKINYKIKKGSGVILTNEDAIKALRSKEEQTKKKKDQIEKKANNEKNKTTQIDNNSAKITRYFKPRICKRKGKESPVNRSCVKKKIMNLPVTILTVSINHPICYLVNLNLMISLYPLIKMM